ncbi:MAG: ABC transporter permease [Acidobacteria bacterium]|nr:ABC transporter permease [Acidobacteriota bacterium]
MRLNALRLLLLIVIVASWELVSGRVISEFFISRPSVIVGILREWTVNGSILFHAGITAGEAFSGFLLGGLAGMTVGIVLGRARLLADVVDPFIMAFYSLPKIALAPLFILWFGIGMDMKIVLTGTVVFFLVFLNTYTGVRNVSRELVAILSLMGAREWHLLAKVVIPSAVTWVFAGLRISVPYALIGAIVGELIASNRGLGFLLADAAGQFDTGGVFAALIAIMLLAFLLNTAVKYTERKAMPWKSADETREVTI